LPKRHQGIARGSDGRLIVAEVGARRLIEIAPDSGKVTEIAANLPIGLTGAPGGLPSNIPTGVAIGLRRHLLLLRYRERDLQGHQEVARRKPARWNRHTRFPVKC